jgi:hypothetical protein
MATPVLKEGDAVRDADGSEYLSSEPWQKMVSWAAAAAAAAAAVAINWCIVGLGLLNFIISSSSRLGNANNVW